MKKLFVLGLVLAISSMAAAGNIDLQIIAGPTAQGEYQGAPSYLPSDTITIALVASGMGTDPDYWIGGMTVDDVTTNNGGTASNVVFNAKFDLTNYKIVNSATLLIEDITAGIGMGDGVGNENVVWFEFHIPELPWSTIITIDATGRTWKDVFDDPLSMTYGGALEIHVVPEPMTIALLGIGGLFLRRRK